MVAYSFKKQFERPIRDLTKGQTIRADRKRHARPGEEVQLYIGMRTKHCRLIGRATCLEVLPCIVDLLCSEVDIYGATTVEKLGIDKPGSLDAFAVQDGFANFLEMELFWARQNPSVLVFKGVLIRWTDFAPASRMGGGRRPDGHVR
ncbi:MAG: hypothetical protein K2X46_17030 [Roseomonas sp.]|nr:hypothetical protein [Roseomonas sp.]